MLDEPFGSLDRGLRERLTTEVGQLVRRVGVTTAARVLQKRKLITYGRGKIRILDRRGLERAACSCYEVVRDMNAGPRG